MGKSAITLITIAVILAYALFVEWAWGWASILQGWQAVGLGAVLGAVALLVSTYFVRAHRIHDYFPNETRGRFFWLFRVTQVHNLLNTMLPFRLGETSFPLLMRSEFGVPVARGAAALLVMRLLDMQALLAAAGIGLVSHTGYTWWAWVLWLTFLIAPVLLFPLRNVVMRSADNVLPARLSHIVDQVSQGVPQSWTMFLRVWVLTVFNWGVKMAVLAWVLWIMGVRPFAAIFGAALGGELSSVLPIHAPGGVGTYPASIVAGAVAFGAKNEANAMDLLARAAINTHLMIVVSALAGTALSLLLAGFSSHQQPKLK
ncbi:lysylphosphatidylglycerol synthase transmembrane domain-containing protein [Mesorhizobium sp. GR13]|nr:lysylphosphatidylglycerol synthase transmembrane domain-containing protein [Mesorhizobium sp. GR13]